MTFKHILRGPRDLGQSYLQLLGIIPYHFIPVERKAVLSRVICRSLINTRVVELVAQRATKGKRTLLMVATLWIQLIDSLGTPLMTARYCPTV